MAEPWEAECLSKVAEIEESFYEVEAAAFEADSLDKVLIHCRPCHKCCLSLHS